MDFGGIVHDVLGGAQGVLRQNVQSLPVTVRTNLNASYPITMTPFTPSDPNARPNPVMLYLQPEIVIGLPTGPVTYSPYGPPIRDDWPIIGAGLALAALTFMGLGAVFKIPMLLTAIAGTGALVSAAKVLQR
jgi:hypothetical protein